ncbi:uncharacterized protein LOC117328901 isoform X2 [Pecten maximus]|uniref:uncharacterized protein LOC117328901 isoform X2 n=1 Tax=Pecten maximus TaxID=6579 RepID=UPI001458E19D|nr:uncharacterized protein LOC117328901 isoform X2 [Pecten maximus]
MYATFIIVMGIYIVICSQVTAHSPTCTWKGNYWSLLPNGEGQCAPCSACPAGQYIRAHCTKRTDTRCVRCQHGYFSLGGFKKKCSKCRKPICQPGYRYIRCKRHRNAECVPCKNNHFYVESTGQCKRCQKCPPGHYVSRLCGIRNDTVCKPCPEGTYIESSGLHLYCSACSFCRLGEQTISACKTDYNTRCGSCSPGYFRLQSSYECAKCSVCYREYPGYTMEVDECRKEELDNDTICMPVAYPPYGYSNDDEYDYELAMPGGITASRMHVFDGELIAVCILVGVIIVLLIAIIVFVVVFHKRKSKREQVNETKKSLIMTVFEKVSVWITESNDLKSTMYRANSEPSIFKPAQVKSKRNSYPTDFSVDKDPESGRVTSITNKNNEQDDFDMMSVSHDDLPSAKPKEMGSCKSCMDMTDNTVATTREGFNCASTIQLVYSIDHYDNNDSQEVSITHSGTLHLQNTNHSRMRNITMIDTGYHSATTSGGILPEKDTYPIFTDQKSESEHRSGDGGISSYQSDDALLQSELSAEKDGVSTLFSITADINVQASSSLTTTTCNYASLTCQPCYNPIELESESCGASMIYLRDANNKEIELMKLTANPKSTFHDRAVLHRSNRDSILDERGQRRKCHSDPLESASKGKCTVHSPAHAMRQSTDPTLYYSESQMDSYLRRCSCADRLI